MMLLGCKGPLLNPLTNQSITFKGTNYFADKLVSTIPNSSSVQSTSFNESIGLDSMVIILVFFTAESGIISRVEVNADLSGVFPIVSMTVSHYETLEGAALLRFFVVLALLLVITAFLIHSDLQYDLSRAVEHWREKQAKRGAARAASLRLRISSSARALSRLKRSNTDPAGMARDQDCQSLSPTRTVLSEVPARAPLRSSPRKAGTDPLRKPTVRMLGVVASLRLRWLRAARSESSLGVVGNVPQGAGAGAKGDGGAVEEGDGGAWEDGESEEDDNGPAWELPGSMALYKNVIKILLDFVTVLHVAVFVTVQGINKAWSSGLGQEFVQSLSFAGFEMTAAETQ